MDSSNRGVRRCAWPGCGPAGCFGQQEDGGPFAGAAGILAGIGLSLPVWIAVALSVPVLR